MDVNPTLQSGPSNLDKVLFKCVDETLGGMVGLVAKDTIYLRILTKFFVTRDDLPSHIEYLLAVIEEGFGEKPAALIGKAIAKRLFNELHLKIPEKENLNLKDYVNEALTQTMSELAIP